VESAQYKKQNFKLKREQKKAVESMIMNQDVLVVLPTCDCKRATKQHDSVCPFTGIVKDQIAKARSSGIKCVSVVDINVKNVSSAQLH